MMNKLHYITERTIVILKKFLLLTSLLTMCSMYGSKPPSVREYTQYELDNDNHNKAFLYQQDATGNKIIESRIPLTSQDNFVQIILGGNNYAIIQKTHDHSNEKYNTSIIDIGKMHFDQQKNKNVIPKDAMRDLGEKRTIMRAVLTEKMLTLTYDDQTTEYILLNPLNPFAHNSSSDNVSSSLKGLFSTTFSIGWDWLKVTTTTLSQKITNKFATITSCFAKENFTIPNLIMVSVSVSIAVATLYSLNKLQSHTLHGILK